jgi:hypothetical protein
VIKITHNGFMLKSCTINKRFLEKLCLSSKIVSIESTAAFLSREAEGLRGQKGSPEYITIPLLKVVGVRGVTSSWCLSFELDNIGDMIDELDRVIKGRIDSKKVVTG